MDNLAFSSEPLETESRETARPYDVQDSMLSETVECVGSKYSLLKYTWPVDRVLTWLAFIHMQGEQYRTDPCWLTGQTRAGCVAAEGFPADHQSGNIAETITT